MVGTHGLALRPSPFSRCPWPVVALIRPLGASLHWSGPMVLPFALHPFPLPVARCPSPAVALPAAPWPLLLRRQRTDGAGAGKRAGERLLLERGWARVGHARVRRWGAVVRRGDAARRAAAWSPSPSSEARGRRARLLPPAAGGASRGQGRSRWRAAAGAARPTPYPTRILTPCLLRTSPPPLFFLFISFFLRFVSNPCLSLPNCFH